MADISIQLMLNSPEPYCRYLPWKIVTEGIISEGLFGT